MKHRKPPWLKLFFKLLMEHPANRLEVFTIGASCGEIIKSLGLPCVYLINNPDAVKYILTTNEKNYTKKGGSYQRLETCLGKGLLTNYGDAWKDMRDTVQPDFHYKHLVPYQPIIAKTTQNFLDDWNTRDNTTIDVVHEMSKLVLEISAITLFGADVQEKAEEAIPIIRALNDHVVTALFPNTPLPLPRYRRFDQARNFIDNLTTAILNSPHPYAAEIKPALKCLWLSPEVEAAEQQRRLDEAKNFMIAGHETTAAALSWTLYLLSKNPDCYAKILDEIDSVLNNQPPTLEQLDSLTYTEMVLNESLRIYPPIWIIERIVIEDDVVQNYLIPSKGKVLMCAYTLHRDPAHWPNPEKFDPERFNPTNRQQRHKYAYLPFGAGPRVCIGKQLAMLMMKTILPMLLQRFTIAIDPHFTGEIEALVTLKPKTNMMAVIKRKN